MKSLISRESHRPGKRYSGVYHIQGGMVTDADLDERSRITLDRTDNLGNDSIMDGVPDRGGAVQVQDDGSVLLEPGTIYADGVRGVLTAREGAELNSPLALFSAQSDFPESPALPANAEHIIYADIWERVVHPLEDPYLADAGLHGAVTAFRTRTMTQLKAAPLAASAQIENGTGNFPKIGTSILAVTPFNAEILADDCDPCADVVSAEQTIANALWRLEVIDVQGTPEAPSRITIAWSIENAATIAPTDVLHDEFERTGKVYEFYSEITESHVGVFTDATDAKRSAFVDDLSTTPSPATDHNGQPWPHLRRWDGQAVINTAGSSIASQLGSGFDLSVTGTTIKLGVEAFEVALDFGGAAIVAGDYWLVELRQFAAQPDRIHLDSPTPLGVMHHYCTLFRVSAAGKILPPTDAEIRKLSFPTLSNLPATHVGFDNTCVKLYDDAENVQEALDNLCDISADDIGFTSNCPELYDDANTVQAALDALCKIDFSVHDSFRHLFDWGVLCGIVPRLAASRTGEMVISPGSYLDRSGRITKFAGGKFNLSDLKIGAGIAFPDSSQLNRALASGTACLALAAQEGGETSLHVVSEALAYGPDDPGFVDSAKTCLNKKQIIDLKSRIAKLPAATKRVANRIVLTTSSEGVFKGSAKISTAEVSDANAFNQQLAKDFGAVANEQEVALLKQRTEEAIKNNDVGDLQGSAREVRQMQQATAVFAAFARTDEERLRRCICEALFPTCPPALGKAPYFVPIGCLTGTYDEPSFFLEKVCPFCCRKQAMTWRSLQYFVGENRERLAKQFAEVCCGQDRVDPGIDPAFTYDPGKYATLDVERLAGEYKIIDAFAGRAQKSPTDYQLKVAVNDLSEAEARKTLIGSGLVVAEEIFDVNDEATFEKIAKVSVGIDTTDQLTAGRSVKPGDRVGLLVQDGVARGYVLLERGSGKLLFERPKVKLDVDISKKDEVRAAELVKATETAKEELIGLGKLRESLSSDVGQLKTDVAALTLERDKNADAVNDAKKQLDDMEKARAEIFQNIKNISKELEGAEKNRADVLLAIRRGQPVTAIVGSKDTNLIARLAGEGIMTVEDISKLTKARIQTLARAGVWNIEAANGFKNAAQSFLKSSTR